MNEILYTVYKTINLLTAEYYIGVHATKNPNDAYLGSGNRIVASVAKYGKKNFIKVILHIYKIVDPAWIKEEELILESKGDSLCLNLAVGGMKICRIGDKFPVEWCRRMSEGHKRNPHSPSPKQRRAISDAKKSVPLSEEHKAHLRKPKKKTEKMGKWKRTLEYREAARKRREGKTYIEIYGEELSKAIKEKIGAAHRGVPEPPRTSPSPLKDKTYEELYGVEDARRRKKSCSDGQLAKYKNTGHSLTGKTFDEIYGEEKAKTLKSNLSVITKQWHQDIRDGKIPKPDLIHSEESKQKAVTNTTRIHAERRAAGYINPIAELLKTGDKVCIKSNGKAHPDTGKTGIITSMYALTTPMPRAMIHFDGEEKPRKIYTSYLEKYDLQRKI